MPNVVSHIGARPALVTDIDQKLLEATAEGCLVVDRDLVATYVNPALCALLGYREEEIVGSHLLCFVAEDSRSTIARQVILRDMIPHRTYEVALLSSEGERLHTIFTASTLHDAGGAPVGTCVFVTDITRRHRQEELHERERERLRETVDGLNRFLAVLCQDLKDPLTALLGMTQMLSTESAGAGNHYAALCADASRQVMRIIENVTLWSRLQLNQVPLDPRVFDVGGLLQDVLEVIEPEARGRDVVIVSRVFDTFALCDLPALVVVLRNLVENAVRYSASGTAVHLRSWTTGENVAVSVSDEGVGIPTDVQPLLFRIDHRHATPDLEGRVGSGLGLVICKALVERMGGEIWLRGAPGRGTTVTFTLPRGSLEQAHPERRS